MLNQRYQIKEILGKGSFSTTYLAKDTHNNGICAIKNLSLHEAKDWKSVELFEREAKILSHLDHPHIPNFIDYFTTNEENETHFYLVQEFIPGRNLEQWVTEGKHFTEKEALDIALSMANILEYIHHFSPPLIHRDIKPNNMIIKPDNTVFLVDFGAVKDKLTPQGKGGSTIVGTFGFMPIEQFEGKAVPASDIYALGATLIYMLSHKEPGDLDKKNLRLEFRPHMNISPGFAHILQKMIEPDLKNRYPHASELRSDLERLRAGKSVKKISLSLPLALGGIALIGVMFSFSYIQSKPPQNTTTPTSSTASETILHYRLAPSKISPVDLIPVEGLETWQKVPTQAMKYSAPNAIIEDSQGQIITTTNYHGITIFQNRNPEAITLQWDHSKMLTLSGKKYFDFKNLALMPDGELWFGIGNGKILRLMGFQNWKIMKFPFPVYSSYQYILGNFKEQPFVAGREGLWFWQANGQKWLNKSMVENWNVTATLVTQEGSLLAASDTRLWIYKTNEWHEFWRGQQPIHVLHQAPNGNIWLGQSKGLIELDQSGKLLRQHLPDQGITRIATSKNGKTWVGTQRDGLYLWDKQWFPWGWREGFPNDHIKSLLIDSKDRIWCGVGGLSGSQGLYIADAAQAEKAIKRIPTAKRLPVQYFKNIEEATDKLLKKQPESGQITWYKSDEQTNIYVRGKQILPRSNSRPYRTPDGQILTINSRKWADLGIRDDRGGGRFLPTPIPKPEDNYPSDGLLDSQKRAWIGTNKSGVYMYNGKQWQHFGAKDKFQPNNPVQVFTEDRQGNIWIGTRAPYQNRHYILPILHRYDGHSWTHYGENDGFKSSAVSVIHSLKNGGVAVSHYTLSILNNNQLKTYTTKNGLKHNNVASINEDLADRLWLSYGTSGRGLSLMENIKNPTFYYLNSRLGLFKDHIKMIAFDGQNRIWLQNEDLSVGVYSTQALLQALKN